MLNKKGDLDIASTALFWPIAGFLIVGAVVGLVIMSASYNSKLTEMPVDLQARQISLRFIANSECFAYQDQSTGKVFPGVIDLQKFTQDQLNKCYFTEPQKGYEKYNFGLQLVGFMELDENGQEKLLMTNNFFNSVDLTLNYPVRVRSDGQEKQTLLKVFVQVPR